MIKTITPIIGNIFFTSDTHFYHNAMIKYCHRPYLCQKDIDALASYGGKWHDGDWKNSLSKFHNIDQESVEIMNDAIVNNINVYVKDTDTLIHLGDFANFHECNKVNYVKNCENVRSKIDCKNMAIIWGNHDNPELIGHLFNWSGLIGKCFISRSNDQKPLEIIMCHYCNAIWDNSHRGSVHLYGHSHSEVENGMDSIMPQRRSLDVGIDNALKIFGDYIPFSSQGIIDLLDKKPGHVFNKHIPIIRNS